MPKGGDKAPPTVGVDLVDKAKAADEVATPGAKKYPSNARGALTKLLETKSPTDAEVTVLYHIRAALGDVRNVIDTAKKTAVTPEVVDYLSRLEQAI